MENVLKGFWSLHGLYEHMLIHANVLDNCFGSRLNNVHFVWNMFNVFKMHSRSILECCVYFS